MALFNGCSKTSKPPSPNVDLARITKIKVNRDGVILLNDEAVTIEALKDSLAKVGQSAGSAVWYYRDSPAGEPHPNAMLVLQAIVDAKLPVRLSTKPDFSDFVGADGRSPSPR
jgi:biopolymer transport protein ExbD